MTKPTDEQLLFSGLLGSVGIGDAEVAAFCQVTKEHAEEWRNAGRRMPFEVALSLVWLAKHCLQKQKAELPAGSSIILLTKTPAQKMVERSESILHLMLERVSWWPSKHYEAARAYTAKRGGQFDLSPETYKNPIIWD
jgi:hypothetical protein